MMKPRDLANKISIILTLLTVFALSVVAQSNGQIAGTVIDANGGVIPGATVTVTNERTGEARSVLAKEDGTFLVVNLRPATYTVAAGGSSFETTTRKNIELLVGQELDLELKLQAKGVSVSVDVVSGEDMIVNTSSASMSANVNAREVEGLPINGRQLSQLYLQAPGGVNSGSGTFSDIRFSGRANNQNVVRYDGIEGTAIIDASPGNLNGEVPSPFRLQSSL
ncbi:MAG: carboxypeptidase-like regulatory domain-containing protein, partial [Pyrinomonadaceae bacterium]|nr:carboxypeptidase-like regulatory domain-containing protein [Pyrinomonadaceae bacterium]